MMCNGVWVSALSIALAKPSCDGGGFIMKDDHDIEHQSAKYIQPNRFNLPIKIRKSEMAIEDNPPHVFL